ncbi:MAG TPA: MFS transporter [Candidatus Dormibacteraeota bacterium]|nr:MFS transporter [Candidatus Dormibacteraeota bacterium]
MDDEPPTPPLRRNRDFQLYWSGQLVSVVGTRIGFIGRPLLVLATTGSPAAAGLASFAFTLPLVLFTLPAGAILDRTNRKRVMVACDVVRGLAAATIVLALWRGWLTFGLILVTSVIGGIAFPFFSVGERASIRRLVARPHLPAAIAQISAREYTGLVAGQSLGGVLFGLGRALPFAADAISDVVSVVSLLLVRTPFQEARTAPRRHLVAEVREGLAWTWRHAFVRTTALLSAGLDSVTNALYLAVIVAAQQRGASAAAVGLLLGFIGLAGVGGALLATRLAAALSLRAVALLTLGTWTALTPVLAVAPTPLLVGLVYGVMFVFHPTWGAAIGAAQLRSVPEPLMGRVQSAVMLVALGAVPLAQLGAGVLLQAVGPTRTILLLAGVMLVTLAAALLSRSLGRPPDDAQAATLRPAAPPRAG